MLEVGTIRFCPYCAKELGEVERRAAGCDDCKKLLPTHLSPIVICLVPVFVTFETMTRPVVAKWRNAGGQRVPEFKNRSGEVGWWGLVADLGTDGWMSLPMTQCAPGEHIYAATQKACRARHLEAGPNCKTYPLSIQVHSSFHDGERGTTLFVVQADPLYVGVDKRDPGSYEPLKSRGLGVVEDYWGLYSVQSMLEKRLIAKWFQDQCQHHPMGDPHSPYRHPPDTYPKTGNSYLLPLNTS